MSGPKRSCPARPRQQRRVGAEARGQAEAVGARSGRRVGARRWRGLRHEDLRLDPRPAKRAEAWLVVITVLARVPRARSPAGRFPPAPRRYLAAPSSQISTLSTCSSREEHCVHIAGPRGRRSRCPAQPSQPGPGEATGLRIWRVPSAAPCSFGPAVRRGVQLSVIGCAPLTFPGLCERRAEVLRRPGPTSTQARTRGARRPPSIPQKRVDASSRTTAWSLSDSPAFAAGAAQRGEVGGGPGQRKKIAADELAPGGEPRGVELMLKALSHEAADRSLDVVDGPQERRPCPAQRSLTPARAGRKPR